MIGMAERDGDEERRERKRREKREERKKHAILLMPYHYDNTN